MHIQKAHLLQEGGLPADFSVNRQWESLRMFDAKVQLISCKRIIGNYSIIEYSLMLCLWLFVLGHFLPVPHQHLGVFRLTNLYIFKEARFRLVPGD